MPTETTPPTPPAPNPKGRANRAAALKGAALSRAFTAPSSPIVQGLTTTLIRIMLTRDGTNDVTITVSEAIRVKLVED